MGRKWPIIMAGVLLLLGIGVMLYPTVSSFINRQNGSYAIQELQQRLEGIDSEEMERALADAQTYNDLLKTPEKSDSLDNEYYENILDFGNGIMGYIIVEKIGIRLPIYHGVSTEVLEKGVGHLPTSAFPIGGEGNHTVLTGHTGLPSAELFTDLTELAVGDRFEITVGSSTTFYQVDQIRVVLPSETSDLMPVMGQDYCTLVTCTPYGVNSHRLLVRGNRITVTEEIPTPLSEEESAPKKKTWIWWLGLLPLVCLPLLKCKKERENG